MERVIKFFVAILISIISIFYLNLSNVKAEETTPPLNVSQVNSFDTCTKQYDMTPSRTFELLLASINANRFKIVEIQSNKGYILFKAAQKDFLASVYNLSSTKSIIKITPTDNNYYFPYGIVYNIFKYIDITIQQ